MHLAFLTHLSPALQRYLYIYFIHCHPEQDDALLLIPPEIRFLKLGNLLDFSSSSSLKT